MLVTGRSTLVGQPPIKSLSSVRMSVRFLKIRSFIYLYFILCWNIVIYTTHSDIVIYTTHYTQIAIQIVFNKQICMLIYVNQKNEEKWTA